MLKPKKIIQILSALALVLFMWLTFAAIQGLFQRQFSQHELFIPSDASSVLEIKGEALITTFISEIILEKRMENELSSYTDSESEGDESLGMDYLSTYYVFTLERENAVITGILVNILDETQFKRAWSKKQEAGTGYAVKNGVGLMLYDSGERPMSAAQLNNMASEIVAKKSGFNLSLLTPSIEDSKANYWRKGYTVENGSKSFSDIKLSLYLKDEVLEVKGNAAYNLAMAQSFPTIKKNDLSIQTRHVPNWLNTLWVSNTRKIGFKFPRIVHASGNYHYSEPSAIPGLQVFPHFDGIYSFAEEFKLRLPLIALAATKQISSLSPNSFVLDGKTIYYEQIDSKNIYLGQTKYAGYTLDDKTLFEVSGDLKRILEVRNGGMMTRLLSISGEYNAANRLLKGIKHSHGNVTKADGGNVDVSAKIEFNDGKSALHELLQFVLEIGVLD